MGTLIDLTGLRFGRLTVIEYAGANAHRKKAWVCRCDCGNVLTVAGASLKNGNTKSCGCYKRDKLTDRNTTHGGTIDRLYGIWSCMKHRCNTPTYKKYKDYGGRGIRVCEEWENSYEAFKSWAMANGYDETAPFGECTIDRIDVNGNYEPTNCRWVDMKTQNNNMRRNCKAVG